MSTQSNKLDQSTVELIAMELIEGEQANSDIARSWEISEPTLYRIKKGDHTLLTNDMRVKLWKKFNPDRLTVRIEKKVEPVVEKPKLQRSALPSLSKLMDDATAPTLTRPAVKVESPKMEALKSAEPPKALTVLPLKTPEPKPAQPIVSVQPKQEQQNTMFDKSDASSSQPQQNQSNQVKDLENFKRTLKALQKEMEHHGISSIAIDKEKIQVSKQEVW